MSRLDNFEKYLERTRKNTPAENFESYANKVNSAGTSLGPSKGESLEEYVARREREQEKINAKRARVEAEKVANKQSEALEWQRQMAEKRAKNQNTDTKTEYASPSQLGGTLKETTITPNTTTSAAKDTAPAGEVLKKLAAERLRNYAIGHGTIATPRSEAEIQADIDKFENENGFAGRLKSALGEAKNLLSGNIDEVYDTAKENQKKTQTLSDLYAEKDAAVLAEFEKLRSNPDFVNNSGYDSAYVRDTKATGNYEKNDSVQRYDFINGVDMAGTHYEYPNDFGAANRDVKNIFSPVLEGYSGVPVHLRTINDSERHLYNYIYKTQGAEAADKYIDALDDTLAARYRGEVTSGAKETASEHPVLSSAATVLTIPARAAAFTGQAADYMEDGRLKNNAPYNAAAYTGSAIREQVGKDIEKNVGGFGGKVASFGYGLAMSMADSLATLPYGQQLAPLVLGSTAAADTVIASKDKGLSDGQAIMLGAVSAAAEALTEKYSVEALLDKTVLGKEGAKRYIAKNIITEASEETASEIANLAADILISKGKSEWQQSINEYKKQGMTEGQAFRKAFLDQLLNVGLSALGGALSGGVMAGASAATDAAVKKAVNHAFKKNQGASYARRDTFDGVLHETAEPEVAEDVSDRDYRVINDLSTLASHVENDEDINSVLTLLETTIDSAQNNTGVFDDVEFVTKQAERIADTLKANGNDIVRGNTTKKSLVAEAYNAPVSELPARLASLVEEVASETEPGNNAINATIDYLRGEIQERGRRVSLATTPEGKRISEIERRVLMELDKTLRSRREEIENIVNAEPKQEPAVAEAPVMTSPADMTENTAESFTESPVADTTRETTESPAAEPEVKRDFTLTHEQTKHTKTGEPLEVFRTSGTLSKEEYAALKSKMKEIGGFYSKFVKGFIVPADQVSAVSEFADVTGENTNRTVGETSPAVGESKPTVSEDATPMANENEDVPVSGESPVEDSTQPTTEAEAPAGTPTEAATETAKEELHEVAQEKEAEPQSVTANARALESAILRNAISKDSIVYGRSVDGFSAEQRQYFVESLIDGVKTDSETIHTDIPYDGTFDIKNDPYTVANILDALHVKVNAAENNSVKKIVDFFKNSDRLMRFTHNGEIFITNGPVAVKVTEEQFAEIDKEFKKRRQWAEPTKNDGLSWLSPDNIQPIAQLPYKAYRIQGGKGVVLFEGADGSETFADINSVKFFDNKDNVWALAKVYRLSGAQFSVVVSMDKDANINGVITPTKVSDASVLGQSAYKSKSKLMDSIGSAAAGVESSDVEVPQDTSTETADENYNRKEESNDERSVETEDRSDVQGLRSEMAETTKTSDGVQEESEPTGGDRGDDGGRVSRTSDGDSDGGIRVRDGESDTSGESDAGADERDDSAGTGGNGTDADDAGPGREPVEKPSAPKKKTRNFSFGEEIRKYINGTRPRTRDNIEAIKTLFQIERENRQATAAEKEILAKYKGWGGLSEAFANYMTNKELRELLSQEEYDAARRSTQNAHYTSLEVIEAMYKGLERMGFTGGNLLEPSMGTGNFFGMLPKKLANKTNLYGVEMDNITGRIARALYGDADITIAPYQDVNYADGSFDAAVGNVPFSSTTYTYKGEKHMLHDYFFVKTLDKVKDGGVVMFITSTGTLDKANPKTRDAIAKQADLVAAFRLPSNAFKTNAGTEVTTDIVVLRKRPAGVPQSGETFFSVGEIDGIPINEYFVRHPENILGTLVSEKGMYANERTQVRADERDYARALSDAMNSLPKNILNTDMAETSVKVETDTQKSRFLESDGGVSFYDSTTGTVTKLTGKKADKAKHFMRLKDAYNGVINIATNPNTSLAEREKARENLGEIYDSFVKEYGKLNSRTVKSDLRGDSEYWMVSALEKKGKTPGTYTKSDIFTEDLYTRGVPKHVDSAHDALAVSLSTRGTVDLDYMAKLTGQSKDAVSSALSDVIVETPDGDWQLTALYLSGNVREKLAEAEKAAENNPKFAHNAEILRAALPRQLSAEEITPKLGASWIDKAYYEEFARSVFGVKPKLSYNNTTGTWEYEYLPYANSAKYGSDGLKLLVPTMNQKQITVRVDGKVDLQATAQQRQRQEMLREEFSAWIFGTSERRTALENKFNELFASWKGADFNSVGAYLSLDGVNPEIKLREYQKGAVARVVFGGDTLLAHGVGTGKTFEMIASAMECKRLGITHKNLFVVPNNKVSDFQNDIHKLYPGAKVMAVTEADFTKDRRAAMISALAANDYDIAVIGHSQFAFIPVSAETKRNALRAQIDEIEATVNGMDSRQDKRTIKQLEKSKESLEKKLKELATRKDDTVNFESLGIDGLFVDEAHNFKSLSYYTKLNVAGAKSGGASQRAQDMFEKTQYLHDIHGRVVFGTATPITNSVAEIYNMTRFVAPDALREAGIESFDAWSANFGNIESKVEISPDGVSFRAKERYSKFSNVNAMIGMFRRFADIIRSEEVLKNLPKAKRVTVECEPNEHLEGFLGKIQKRVDALKGSATKKDNMLLVTNDGRAAAIDLRLVAKQLDIPMSELDLPGSKINRTVENVAEEYKNSSKNKGTQLIFLDYGMSGDPDARYGFDLYTDIVRKLAAQGIPANEIVRLDKVDNKKLDELYEKVNSGEVRVLIGSTARMGEGLNVQKRLVALHHLNPPYRPSDIEQREGRIIRFGNENKDVRIYRYVQKRSFDSYMWQMLERKQIMINQAMSGGDVNEIDDVDEFVLSAAEAKALASGNPLLLEKSELDDRFSKLSTSRSVFLRSVYNAQDILSTHPGRIQNTRNSIRDVQENARIINAHPFDGDFEITLRDKKYTDRKTANETLSKILTDGRYSVNKTYEIGSVRGMKLSFMQEGQHIALYLDGAKRIELESGTDNITRIVNALNRASNPKAQLESMQSHLAQLEKALEDAKKLVGSEFPQQQEYDEVLSRLNEVNRLMNEAAGVKAGGEIIDDEGMVDDFGDEDSDDGIKRPSTSQSTIEGKWGKGTKDGKKLKSVYDLKNEAERLFGVPINVGKVEGGKNVRGIYKTHANTIRTRVYGDLPTIAHELGHYFERKYNLSYSTAVDELIEVYHDLLEDAGYNESLYPFEAVANYFAELMYNSKSARESAPEFSEYLDSVISVADKKKLDEYVRMTNEYHAADLRRRREAQLKYRTKENSWHRRAQLQLEDFTENPAAYSGRLSDGFVRNWIDDIVDLKPFGKTYDFAMRERTAGSIIDGRLNIAFTDNSGNIIGKSLAAILAEGNITQLNHEAFDNYLIQRIALDRIEAAERGETEATMVYADPELQNKDNIIKAIEDYETENPTFKDAAKGIYEYRHNLLSIAVDAGVVSAELADYLERTYPHYVPLNRVMDDKSKASSGKSGKVQGSPIKSFKGSGRAIYSPIENLMLQTASFSNAVLQNQVRQEFADYIDSHEDMGWVAEKVEPDKYFDTVSTNPIYHRLMRFQSEDLNSLTDEQKQNLFDDVMDYIGDSVGMWKVNPHQDEKIITVLRNGQREYYEMHDEHVMDALNTLDHKQSHILIEAVGKATGWFKVLTTGNNPEFGFTNIPRDVQSGFVSSTTTNNPFKYFGDYFAAFGQAVVNSKGYKEYLRNGGGFQGSYTADIGRLKQKYSGVIKNPRKLSRILHGAVSLYTHMLDAGESASRYAEYKRARKLGIDALEAMRKSQEITVNFSRHGKASKELDKVIPYFNAAVQSMYHMYDVLFHGEKKTAAWVKFVSGSIVPSALMLAWNYILAPIAYSDDEEEEKILKSVDTLSTYNKNAYWCFYAGDGKFIRIAKPKDMTVFSTVITNMFELYVRENPAAFYDYGTYLLETLVPPHSLDDFMIFGTKASLDKNETFTGSPIVPTAYQGLTPEMQYNENTSRLAIAVGSALNISPMKIDFVIDDLGGFVGDVMLSLTSQKSGAEIAKETFGLSDVISADSVYSNNIASLFYDAKEEYESSAKSYPKGHEKYDAYADYGAYKYGKIAELYSDVNKLIKKHQDSQATRAARDTLNTIIDSVNHTSETKIDRAVSEIAELTGEKVSDIAPYIVVPTSLKDSDKNEYILGPYDMMEYYLESQAYLEAWYYDILTSGYDAETIAESMKAAKKEVKKTVDAHYLEVMQNYFQ